MPTSRNARGVDVITYNMDCTQILSIQVKSLSQKNDVPLGNSLAKIMGDFWVIVTNVMQSPTSYILSPSEVRENAGMNSKDERVSFWLGRKYYDREEFREAWNRIGTPGI